MCMLAHTGIAYEGQGAPKCNKAIVNVTPDLSLLSQSQSPSSV